jgi:hypothetical protein
MNLVQLLPIFICLYLDKRGEGEYISTLTAHWRKRSAALEPVVAETIILQMIRRT